MKHEANLSTSGGMTVRYCEQDASTCIHCAKIALADAVDRIGELESLLKRTIPAVMYSERNSLGNGLTEEICSALKS